MLNEFDDKNNEREISPKEYSLRAKRHEHPPLTELGVDVYEIEGWELVTLILRNVDYFKKEENSWYATCMGGITRSDLTNNLLKLLDLLKVVDNTPGKRDSGFSFNELTIKLAQADEKDGKLIFSDFKGGINRFALFLSKDMFDIEDALIGLTNSLKQVSRENPESSKITFFIMNDTERFFRTIHRFVKDLLEEGKSPNEIADLLEERYNDDKKIKKLDVSEPQKLFI